MKDEEQNHSCGEATPPLSEYRSGDVRLPQSGRYTQTLLKTSYSFASRFTYFCIRVVLQPADHVLNSWNSQEHAISLSAPTLWYISACFVPFYVSRVLIEQELSSFQVVMILTCSLPHKQKSLWPKARTAIRARQIHGQLKSTSALGNPAGL